MKRTITIPDESADGHIEITEDELPTLTKAELKQLGISRADLHLVFAEGQRQMQERGITERDRIRPCADQMLDGQWIVMLGEYSPLSDPLMPKRATKKQKQRAN